MEGESGVTRSISDELNSRDIQRDPREDKSRVTQSNIDELNSSDIQGDQMEGERSVTGNIIDELLSLDMIKWKLKVVLLEVSLVRFILRISSKGR